MTAKWRTKNGCLTCRKRRKKCDEGGKGRGTCIACCRNSLTCIWPGQDSKVITHRKLNMDHQDLKTSIIEQFPDTPSTIDSQDPITLYEAESVAPTPTDANLGWLIKHSPFKPSTWHGTRPDSHFKHELFHYYATTVCRMMIRGDSHPGFKDWTYTISQALEHQCLMDTLLACSAVHLSHKRPEMTQLAFGFYSSAVSKTQAKIEAGELNGSEDWLLIMVCHLAIFERNQPESTSNAALHLQGAVHLMSLKRAKVRSDGLISIKPHQRLYAESVIYNTSFTAFLSPDVSWLSSSDIWSQVDVFCTANPYPGTPESSISPLVGVPVKICYLILQVSCLARQLPRSEEDFLKAERVRAELDVWLMDIENENDGVMGGLSWRSAKLFIFSADVLLFKAQEPFITASHPRILMRVKQSLDLLKEDDLEGKYWNQHFCWPITIIACAVLLREEFWFLQHRAKMLWEKSYFGDVKRVGIILQEIWDGYYEDGDRRIASDASLCSDMEVQGDTIDLLLCREGLCSILGE